MDRLDSILDQRENVAEMYNQKLLDIKEIQIPFIDSNVTRMSWFVYVIQIEKEISRNNVMKYLKENGVACRPYFTPIHIQPYMKEKFGFKENDYPITADIGNRSIALPFFNKLSEKEIDYVVTTLKKAILNEKQG